MMKEFIKKWKTDKKFKNIIQLCLYSLFIVFVIIYASTGTKSINNNVLKDTYNYEMTININDKIYKYTGTKEEDKIIINKTTDDITTKYVYEDDKYYKTEDNVYITVDEKEVYETIDFSYISIDTINQYLDLSTPRENDRIVYIYDIIVGSDSEEYITIETSDKYYKVDYTQLMKLFNNNIEKLTVEIIIE